MVNVSVNLVSDCDTNNTVAIIYYYGKLLTENRNYYCHYMYCTY